MQLANKFLIHGLLYASEVFRNFETVIKITEPDTYLLKDVETIYHNYPTGYLDLILIITDG